MSNLMLSFAVGLHVHAINKYAPIHGPLFHRWLPNGKADAIRLSSDIPSSMVDPCVKTLIGSKIKSNLLSCETLCEL
jgi:hypothetical protein